MHANKANATRKPVHGMCAIQAIAAQSSVLDTGKRKTTLQAWYARNIGERDTTLRAWYACNIRDRDTMLRAYIGERDTTLCVWCVHNIGARTTTPCLVYM